MHTITKNAHEITHEVLTGQVIEERHTLCTVSTWPTKITKKYTIYFKRAQLRRPT